MNERNTNQPMHLYTPVFFVHFVSLDFFESISSEVKRSKFPVELPNAPNALKKSAHADPIPAQDLPKFKAQLKLFEKLTNEDGTDATPPEVGEIPDILDLAHLWEWAGVSFGKEETFKVFLSLKRLVELKPLKSVRLWGKILGLQGSYIIAEGELREGAVDEDDEIANSPNSVAGGDGANGAAAAAEGGASAEGADGNADGGAAGADESGEGAAADAEGGENAAVPAKKEEDDLAITKPKTGKYIGPLSKEARSGVNKYVYYVCNYRKCGSRLFITFYVHRNNDIQKKLTNFSIRCSDISVFETDF
jgi:radial spoke head protein 4A